MHNRVNEDRGTQGERHPREQIGKDNLKVDGEGIYQDSHREQSVQTGVRVFSILSFISISLSSFSSLL